MDEETKKRIVELARKIDDIRSENVIKRNMSGEYRFLSQKNEAAEMDELQLLALYHHGAVIELAGLAAKWSDIKFRAQLYGAASSKSLISALELSATSAIENYFSLLALFPDWDQNFALTHYEVRSHQNDLIGKYRTYTEAHAAFLAVPPNTYGLRTSLIIASDIG